MSNDKRRQTVPCGTVALGRLAIRYALQIAVVACEAARKDGFYVEFGIGLNPFGQYALQQPVGLIKRF